ncbi:TetR/AcrR family transcriptional regulator [Rhodobacteraceae bacterium KMM 6894]|nr:TetR/AcrR family transcriptional regulator [Rhodobacteraceae bacterium KMM 6894]
MNKVAATSEDKREDILLGAFEEFCENGFLAASMDRISKRAGASKRTVYRYFESKEQLFQTLVHRQWTLFADGMKVSFRPGVEIREQLTDMGRAQARLFMSPDIMAANKMLMSEILRDPQIVSEIQNEIDYTASFEQLLKEAAADGLLDLQNPRQAAEEFISLLKGKAFWPVMFGAPLVGADEMADMIDSTVDMMMCRYGNGSRSRDELTDRT